MKILFAGTPDIAVPSLRGIANNFNVVGVLTAPDRASGRGRQIRFSPVKSAALELNLPVLQPTRLNTEARASISLLKCDILVVFAYGQIFGPKFLSLFPLGGINMHPSALPRYRGPSPITATILNGNTKSALTVQRIALEMDAGDIIRQTPFNLDGTETTGSLTDRIAVPAADELIAALKEIAAGRAVYTPQNLDDISYCHIVKKQDGIIDWRQNAVELERRVRAFFPWPKAQTVLGGKNIAVLDSCVVNDETARDLCACGTVLGIHETRGILVQTGHGILGLRQLQAASKNSVDFRTFINGTKIEAGMRFG